MVITKLMCGTPIVEFKSIPKYYMLECLDIKNNTIRLGDSDIRFNYLKGFELGDLRKLKIRIHRKGQTKQSFERDVINVTSMEVSHNRVFVITWRAVLRDEELRLS